MDYTELTDAVSQLQQQYQLLESLLHNHGHSGVSSDGRAIDPKFLMGFPIISSAPTDTPNNGIIRLYWDGTHARIYARINNTWKYKTLDNT